MVFEAGSLTGKNVVVAMSGGVDSSVTAALVKKAGATVRGIFMQLAQPDVRHEVERAQGVARHLDIPLEVVDLSVDFKDLVLDYFAESYFCGKTPNPCVVCNRLLKCGKLLTYVQDKFSADFLATGHYARISRDEDGFHLLKGMDHKKDQSYFLCRLDQEQLSHLLFPLGEVTKEQVYKMAEDLGLAGKHGRESQDVCFLKDQSVAGFLSGYSAQAPGPGEIISSSGARLKSHRGIHNFTVGQRRGLGIPDSTPYYVIGLDAESNTVIVGKDDQLWHSSLRVQAMHWLSGSPPDLPGNFEVKIRYRHAAAPATVVGNDDGSFNVRFHTPQRAITPGQFVVLYDGDEVVAGGEIGSAN